MTELDTLIKTVAEGLKSMAQGIEVLAKKLETISKSRVDEKAKREAEAKPALEAPAKPTKTVAKKAVKKAAPKKEKPLTAVDTVLGVIKRSKKGVNVSTLMEKTGFNKKKIYNNVTVLKKQGKIKSVGWGVYLKA